ncbi:MAG: hypothetical protein IKK43_00195 [Clostridia bacterium]|nr:hypothetical protein [Clostridia bacterium]
MQIKTFTSDLRFAEGLVKTVADEFLKALKNSIIFSAKLENVMITIEPIGIQTAGLTGTTDGENRESYVKIFVCEDDPVEFITFVIAHEFAHLMMINLNDILKLTNRANDGSTAYTAVTRLSSSGQEYGRAFEEAVADKLAMYIIKRIYGNDGVKKVMNKLFERQKHQLKIVDMFTSIFGKKLENCSYIDEYSFSGNCGSIANIFWYKVVTFDFGRIINICNEVMGTPESFSDFAKSLDEYFEEEGPETLQKLYSWLITFQEKAKEEA